MSILGGDMRSFLVIGTFLISALITPLTASGRQWEDLFKTARSLYDSLEYDSAIMTGNRALTMAEKSLGDDDPALGKICYWLGRFHKQSGHFAEAESYLRRALAIRKAAFGSESEEVAAALDALGDACGSLAKYDQAGEYIKRALAIREKLFGRESLKRAHSLVSWGRYLSTNAEYQRALSAFEEALAIREKLLGPEHHDVAVSLSRLSGILLSMGKFEEAESKLLKARDIFSRNVHPFHPDYAECLDRIGDMYVYQERYIQARPYFEQAYQARLELFGPESIHVAKSLLYLGVIFRYEGKYSAAIDSSRSALSLVTNVFGRSHPLAARCMLIQGVFHADLGHVVEAERLLRQAIEIMENIFGKNHPRIAHCLYYLVAFQKRYLSDSEQVKATLQRALAILDDKAGLNHPLASRLLSSLGALYMDAYRDYQKAEECYLQSLEISERTLGPESTDYARALAKLGYNYSLKGEMSLAVETSLQALDIMSGVFGAEHPYVTKLMVAIGLIYLAENRPDKGEEIISRSVEILDKHWDLDDPMALGPIEVLSHIKWMKGDYRQSFELSMRIFHTVRKIYGSVVDVLSERDALKRSYRHRNILGEILALYFLIESPSDSITEEMADCILDGKGVISDKIYERQREFTGDNDPAVDTLIESLRRTEMELSGLYVRGPGMEPRFYRQRLDSLGNLANDIETELTRHCALFRERSNFQTVNTERAASLLPQGAVLIEFLKYHDYNIHPEDGPILRYAALILKERAKPVILNLGPGDAIDEIITRYRRHMNLAATSGLQITEADMNEYRSINDSLLAAIWQPLEKYMEGYDLLLIAPDGELNTISFAGLIDSEGRYFAEKHAVHYLSAGRDLVRLATEKENGRGLLAMGDPNFDAPVYARIPEGYSPGPNLNGSGDEIAEVTRSACGELNNVLLNALPGTRKEIAEITAAWRESADDPVRTYFGVEATEDRFKREAPGCRIIHLATHGYYLGQTCRPDKGLAGDQNESGATGENPLLHSGLFLAGANLHGDGADSAGIDDGILTAYEIASMDLRGTDLVALSACETGRGDIRTGEGVYGLRRAFQMAGVRTVISSLWPVSDRTTAEIFSDLYRRGDRSLPATMQKIQMQLIDKLRSSARSDHPVQWSGFISLGDWR